MADPGDLILSLDIGTTAIKVGVFSTKGELRQLAQREQQLSFPQPDRVEQSLDATWELICSATREAIEFVDPRGIQAVVLSTHRGSVVALDAAGQPLTDLIVWMDQRGLGQVASLQELIGPQEYYATSGHPIVPVTGVSKILWMMNEAPEIWERAVTVGSPQTFFLRKLGADEAFVDYSSGSYLFPNDIRRRTWSSSIADIFDVPLDKLPHLVPAEQIVGELHKHAADELDLPPGIPLVAGGGDGQCAAAGTGVVAPGTVMVNIGTAAGVQVFLEEPAFEPGHTLNCAAHVVSGAWEMEGHTQASGTVLRWFRDEFGGLETLQAERSQDNAYDLLVNQATEVPAGSDGLIFLPTFNGITAPIVDHYARGALLGLKLSHGRGHVIRAVLEGISLEIRWMLDAMAAAGVPVVEVRLSGGGSRNRHWNQIHADVFGRPIRPVRNPDSALVGAAICAAVALGAFNDYQTAAERFVELGPAVEPHPGRVAVYQGSYERFVRLFELLHDGEAFKPIPSE